MVVVVMVTVTVIGELGVTKFDIVFMIRTAMIATTTAMTVVMSSVL